MRNRRAHRGEKERAGWLLVACFVAFPLAARADCSSYSRKLQQRQQLGQALSQREEAYLEQLRTADSACKEKGASLSRLLATAAEGGSCAALGDSAQLDGVMRDLGGRCVTALQTLHENHHPIFFRTGLNHLGVAYANRIGAMFPSVQGACAKELHAGAALASRLGADHARAVASERDTLLHGLDYQQLSAAAGALARVSGKRGGDCEQVLKTVARGKAAEGARVPKGRSRSPASDITGTEPRKKAP